MDIRKQFYHVGASAGLLYDRGYNKDIYGSPGTATVEPSFMEIFSMEIRALSFSLQMRSAVSNIGPGLGTPAGQGTPPTTRTYNQTSGTPAGTRPVPSFLELCINTGNSCQSLGEVEVTHIASDTMMFAYICKRYREIRGFRVKKHFLMKPVKIKYVSFALEGKRKVHIFDSERDSFPTQDELNAKTWHYQPCPPKPPPPMPSSAFIHYLTSCKADVRVGLGPGFWLARLPKKMHESLARSSDPLPMAWGIHIIEGPDMVAVFWTMICVLTICLTPLVAYLVVKKDVQGTAGIGSLAVSVMTLLWMCMKICEWKDG
ncbi:hypothetical protein W97_01020 [Coniosporium apollinis CBS 100218]|uniref:Uncharacterized protein n=1 Tax=Coniosporium apollinis (strain CBS 100218) TaxID=1168221 RepID=R7YIT8_CONA1|nr:uncharacterized protein W97_01020 [Coniosporium apollinis CBS 100218]EON61803.1 hypothetical protein W97_01020 [Coniosporium apollinis CBS 100218]